MGRAHSAARTCRRGRTSVRQRLERALAIHQRVRWRTACTRLPAPALRGSRPAQGRRGAGQQGRRARRVRCVPRSAQRRGPGCGLRRRPAGRAERMRRPEGAELRLLLRIELILAAASAISSQVRAASKQSPLHGKIRRNSNPPECPAVRQRRSVRRHRGRSRAPRQTPPGRGRESRGSRRRETSGRASRSFPFPPLRRGARSFRFTPRALVGLNGRASKTRRSATGAARTGRPHGRSSAPADWCKHLPS